MKPEDAEEYTQALGQVVAGGWRQIALGQRLGVPKALNLTTDDWVKQRLGGYVKYSVGERDDAIRALRSEGFTYDEIQGAIGTGRTQISEAIHSPDGTAHKQKAAKKHALNSPDGTEPMELMTGLAATDAVRDQIEADARKVKRAEDRQTARAAAAAAAKDNQPTDLDATIQHATFTAVAQSISAGTVDLIFTDPPYHDQTLPLYAELGTVAASVLKDGGSLITYTSHHRMPEVIAMLQAAGLTFFWPLAMVHTGPKARMTEYGIVVNWKPLLWFVKGPFRSRDDLRFVNDLVESAPQKDAHPWQQGILEAEYYIEALTDPGDFIFDPFCGGGTTACAAARLQRRWLTCDVDEQSVWIARQRLRDAVAA